MYGQYQLLERFLRLVVHLECNCMQALSHGPLVAHPLIKQYYLLNIANYIYFRLRTVVILCIPLLVKPLEPLKELSRVHVCRHTYKLLKL